MSAFQTYFPDKPLSVALIPNNAFPSIDNNTNLITNPISDANQPLLALAGQELPGRLVVQYNFLMTSNAADPAVPAAAQSYGALTAYQSNNYYGQSGGGAACGGTPANPQPCADSTYLEELREGIYPLGRTNSLRSQYLEAFPTNALAFTNAIWQAHQELFSPP